MPAFSWKNKRVGRSRAFSLWLISHLIRIKNHERGVEQELPFEFDIIFGCNRDVL